EDVAEDRAGTGNKEDNKELVKLKGQVEDEDEEAKQEQEDQAKESVSQKNLDKVYATAASASADQEPLRSQIQPGDGEGPAPPISARSSKTPPLSIDSSKASSSKLYPTSCKNYNKFLAATSPNPSEKSSGSRVRRSR
ncbi:unnamed protein product, partial [Amoebophrya sp. A25]